MAERKGCGVWERRKGERPRWGQKIEYGAGSRTSNPTLYPRCGMYSTSYYAV